MGVDIRQPVEMTAKSYLHQMATLSPPHSTTRLLQMKAWLLGCALFVFVINLSTWCLWCVFVHQLAQKRYLPLRLEAIGSSVLHPNSFCFWCKWCLFNLRCVLMGKSWGSDLPPLTSDYPQSWPQCKGAVSGGKLKQRNKLNREINGRVNYIHC